MFDKIVVGIDGSEISENALKTACEMATKFGSELHLIHTPQPKTVAFAMGAVAGYHTVTTMPAPEEVEKAGNKILDSGKEVAKKYGQTIHQVYLGHGEPANEITDCAEQCGVGLIVTGRCGLGNLSVLIQGSTSLKINHIAKCACLSVI